MGLLAIPAVQHTALPWVALEEAPEWPWLGDQVLCVQERMETNFPAKWVVWVEPIHQKQGSPSLKPPWISDAMKKVCPEKGLPWKQASATNTPQHVSRWKKCGWELANSVAANCMVHHDHTSGSCIFSVQGIQKGLPGQSLVKRILQNYSLETRQSPEKGQSLV